MEGMRTLKRILLLLLLLVIGAGLWLWQRADSLAERQIKSLLEAQHIPVQSLTVTDLSTKHIGLSDVALGEGGALRAKTATIDFKYGWSERKLGSFEATLDGVEIRAQLEDGEIFLGGVEKAWSTALLTPTPETIAIQLDGQLHVKQGENGDISVDLDHGLLTLIQRQKNMLLPLQVNASAQGEGQNYRISGTFNGDQKNVQGSFKGQYAMDTQRGSISWDTKPMSFSSNGLTFADLSPGFADGFSTIATKASLSGTVDLKPNQWTITPKLTLLELPVDHLLAQALGENTVINGTVKGTVPIRISKGGKWRIEQSRLINIGPMKVKLDPAMVDQTMGQHEQSGIVKAALSNLDVKTLTLDVASTDDKGGVKLVWHFVGSNAEVLQGKPVDFTLAVTANLQDMWQSMQEVKRATQEAERQLLKKSK